MEKVRKFLSKDGCLRASIVDATKICGEVCLAAGTMPIATTFLGRTVVGAILLSSQNKDQSWVQLTFDGNGPLENVWARAHFEGLVGGNCRNPAAFLPLKNGRIDVSGAIGIGLLHVDISQRGGSPYRGTVHIAAGEVGDDIAFYLDQSQQTPSVVSVGVHMDRNGHIDAAGGILIELMPGHTEDHIKQLEENLKKVSGPSELILNGGKVDDFVQQYLAAIDLEELENPYALSLDPKLLPTNSKPN